jgi:AcrR family transcriptional regulator
MNRPAYHHGDARNALLSAASELLEAAGAAGLSLRQVAEHAGLSRQAPYNHFQDKQSLLAELVREGFDRLARDMTMAAGEDQPPVARLQAAGERYIAFAQERPALFRLMFSREIVDLSRFPEARGAGAASYAVLVQIVAGIAPPEKVADFALVAWSTVHGYATLCNEAGIEPPAQRASRAALFTQILAAGAKLR